MGQEYDEPAPWQFFTSFDDATIKKAVSAGRIREFERFGWSDVPDPQEAATFERSRLQWLQSAENLEMLGWYRALLRLRREYVLAGPRTAEAAWSAEHVLTVEIPAGGPRLKIRAALPGAVPPAYEDERWRLELENDQDGYRTQIYVRAEG